MSLDALVSYGMQPVATVHIDQNVFLIDLLDEELARQERCIDAFLVNDEIVRIGSSKAPLLSRLKAWSRDVSNALQGRRSPTSLSEADGWRAVLQSGHGIIHARPGTIVRTPVGEMSAYLDEESVLIARHRPRFCRR